ncbi:MAG: type I-G CRISPR-associated protein Csb2, partial [Stackebrandtia sp.]
FEMDLIVRGFASGKVPLPGEEVVQVSQTFRAAMMERAQRYGDTLPRQVSGHGADDVAHLAYLALPSVGYDYADGHLLGVAVAVPSGMDVQERAIVVQAVSTMTNLTSSERWSFALAPATQTLSQWGLNPRRWAPRDGATDWVSATPVMLDHFPKKSGKNTGIHRVAESLVRAGYPQPSEVEIVPSPPLTGGIHRPGTAEALRRRGGRPMVHCRVRFPVPVHGPVLAGRLRYLGVGLFVPDQKGETGGTDR